MVRSDDYEKRRQHLSNLSEEELDKSFWDLAERITEPLIDLANTHTTPSIERSVLQRMGFSSIESKVIVDGVLERGLMGKGAGNIVYKLANKNNIDIREAGLELVDGNLWDQIENLFSGGGK